MPKSAMIGAVWHPSPGVNQLSITLGRPVPVSLTRAIDMFGTVPEVVGAGAVMGMWSRGNIDLKLTCATVSPDLRARLQAVCNQLLAAGH